MPKSNPVPSVEVLDYRISQLSVDRSSMAIAVEKLVGGEAQDFRKVERDLFFGYSAFFISSGEDKVQIVLSKRMNQISAVLNGNPIRSNLSGVGRFVVAVARSKVFRMVFHIAYWFAYFLYLMFFVFVVNFIAGFFGYMVFPTEGKHLENYLLIFPIGLGFALFCTLVTQGRFAWRDDYFGLKGKTVPF